MGSTTPGSNLKIEQRYVKSVESCGMLCSAYDVGWVDQPDGVLIQLPDSFQPGNPYPTKPPNVSQTAEHFQDILGWLM